MKSQGMQGRVFNSYGLGGYLIYQLTPNIEIYIDGRTDILYPIEHMKVYGATLVSSTALLAELDKYQIDKVVWPVEKLEMHDLLLETGQFHLEFMDASHALYVRKPTKFQLLGQLLTQPACWRPEMGSRIESEQESMVDILPYYSRLFPFAGFVDGYSNATDKKSFLDASFDQLKWNDEMIRFAMFRFAELGYGGITINLLAGIEKHRPQDYAITSMMAFNGGELKVVSRLLQDFSSQTWLFVSGNDLQIFHALYTKLAEIRSLDSWEAEGKANITKALANAGLSEPDIEMDLGMFCPAQDMQY